MCGIAGIYHFDKAHLVKPESVVSMLRKIEHRGPDGSGYYTNDNVGLGHVRLSIIDLENGAQPFYSSDKSMVLVYNGEIYNYKELRSELIQQGCSFNTDSDTEVVLNAYKIWGEKCLGRFNGMWAFAIWDKSKGELFLSRDRLGIKPLYFKKDGKSFIFSSEIKGLLNESNNEINKLELWDALVMGPKDGGNTIYKDIKELYPGSFVKIKDNKLRFCEYFQLEKSLSIENNTYSLEEIEELIIDSIKIRLVSDVKLGTLNSGGLDSSLISSIACRVSDHPLQTFSISPDLIENIKQPGDESEFAQLLSAFLKTSHQTIRYNQNDLVSDLRESTFYNDSFLYHSNSVPLSLMFSEIKNTYKTTVVLGGEGADEVFRGYGSNRLINLYRTVQNIPIISGYVKSKYFNNRNDLNWVVKGQPFITGESIKRKSFLNDRLLSEVLNIKPEVTKDRQRLFEKLSELPLYNQAIYYEQKCYLAGLLQRVDRMSMRWGVEARVPFLDYRLVEYLNSIKFSHKSGITHNSVKKILKKISKKYVQQEIISRKKYGFATPTRTYKDEFIRRILTEFDVPFNKEKLKGENADSIYLLYNYFLHKDIYRY